MGLTTLPTGVNLNATSQINANFLVANTFKVGFSNSSSASTGSTSWADLQSVSLAASLECFGFEYDLDFEANADAGSSGTADFQILVTYNDASTDTIALTGKFFNSTTLEFNRERGFFKADDGKYITSIKVQGRNTITTGTGANCTIRQPQQNISSWSNTTDSDVITGIKYYYKV